MDQTALIIKIIINDKTNTAKNFPIIHSELYQYLWLRLHFQSSRFTSYTTTPPFTSVEKKIEFRNFGISGFSGF